MTGFSVRALDNYWLREETLLKKVGHLCGNNKDVQQGFVNLVGNSTYIKYYAIAPSGWFLSP